MNVSVTSGVLCFVPLQEIQSALLPGEVLEAVYDMKGGGTGVLGITSKRVNIYDKTFMRKMKALVSIPYAQITSIAAERRALPQTWFASEFECQFTENDHSYFRHESIARAFVPSGIEPLFPVGEAPSFAAERSRSGP